MLNHRLQQVCVFLIVMLLFPFDIFADAWSEQFNYWKRDPVHTITGNNQANNFSQLIQIPEYLLFPGRDYLYFSSNFGNEWTRLNPKKDISDATYITSAAINPVDQNHFVLGTSYQGLFESRNAGESWTDMDPDTKLAGVYQGAGFYSEIRGLAFAEDGKTLYIRTAHRPAVYALNLGTFDIREIDTSELTLNSVEYAEESVAETEGSDGLSIIPQQQALFSAQVLEGKYWPEENFPVPPTFLSDNQIPANFAQTEAWSQRRETASNKAGIYINAYQLSTRTDEFIQYLQEQGFNSVVIDFKDDQGILRYDSKLELAQEVGSIRSLYNASDIIRRFHDIGVYVIARIVVFKDKALHRYNNSKYSFWDKRLQEPWGVYRSFEQEPSEDNPNPDPVVEQVEFWVDPYSEFVRSYNIQIAKELEALGVDEIQFDYIRFPSDGRTWDIQSRFVSEHEGSIDQNSQRVQILATFLSEARENISIPIGIDVFGFNGWARMSYLGQDIEVLSHYVDVISPMSYPSHYPRSFYNNLTYLDKAQQIYEAGTQQAREITQDRVLIRQYVQAFLLGGERNFDEPVYYSYLHRQLDGVVEGGGNGFTLWNNSGRYYMVSENTADRYIRPTTQTRNTQSLTE